MKHCLSINEDNGVPKKLWVMETRSVICLNLGGFVFAHFQEEKHFHLNFRMSFQQGFC